MCGSRIGITVEKFDAKARRRKGRKEMGGDDR